MGRLPWGQGQLGAGTSPRRWTLVACWPVTCRAGWWVCWPQGELSRQEAHVDSLTGDAYKLDAKLGNVNREGFRGL